MTKKLNSVMVLENSLWDECKADCGSDIRENKANADLFVSRIKEFTKSMKFTQKDYDVLEDQNYHLLNLVLCLLGKFGEEKRQRDFAFCEQQESEGHLSYSICNFREIK